ncbi:MAG: FAD-dependent oxidoreductase [Actinomycetota bacterium]|nr:FAD-dependent oxidoreductase [Actinomycetota bacterium]
MRVAIVGAGLAAANAVDELRSRGHEGSIDVFGQEPHLPYNRPPLSKGVLLGSEDEGSIFVHDEQWYADRSVTLHLDTVVTGLDLDRSYLVVGDDELPYDRLLIATGASPRRLPAADESGVPVAYLRTLEDNRRLRAAFRPGRKVVIIGGGWIGLEVAAAARTAGAEVALVESLDLPLLRVLGPEVAATFADLHRAHGVDLRLGATVESFDEGGVRLGDGSQLTAELLVVGIGVEPNDDLAAAAGLAVDNGILVDERLRASDPHVYAAGDVANHLHPTLGRRIRVEHWDTAIHQGRAAARTMLGGDEVYDRQPYFFTDQYDLGMEYVGSVGPEGYDDVVVRGDPAGTHTAYWLRDGRVLAGMHVNDWDAIDTIRETVGAVIDPAELRSR